MGDTIRLRLEPTRPISYKPFSGFSGPALIEFEAEFNESAIMGAILTNLREYYRRTHTMGKRVHCPETYLAIFDAGRWLHLMCPVSETSGILGAPSITTRPYKIPGCDYDGPPFPPRVPGEQYGQNNAALWSLCDIPESEFLQFQMLIDRDIKSIMDGIRVVMGMVDGLTALSRDTQEVITEEFKRKRGRPPGIPNPNAGKRRTAPGIKQKLTLEIEPDLYDWIKQQPAGTAERILKQAHIDSLIV